MSYGLEGRVALVTGGASGIGRAIVERLSIEGMTVVFTGRSEDRGSTTAAETGATFVRADASDRQACDRSVEKAIAHGRGRLDAFVSNAAIVFRGPIEKTPEPAFRELVEVNLTAAFRYSRACFPKMREQGGGSMIHIASDAAIRGLHGIAAYSVTKAGVRAMSELFAAEGTPYGIRSNSVCPGATFPGVQSTPAGHEDHAENAAEWTLPPSGRFGTGADVAALVAWLVSDESTHVNGATLRVDGAAAAAMHAVTRA